MSIPIRFPEPDIFRVDADARRKAMAEELQRSIKEQINLEALKNSRTILQEFVPQIHSFSKSHAAEALAVGSGDDNGETLIFYEKVPNGFIGMLESMALTPLGGIPGTWYRVLIDGEPIDGYTGKNGKIERSIGTFNEPRAIIPPIIIYEDLRIYAGNTTVASWTAGFSNEGIHVQKPLLFDIKSPLVSISTIQKFVKSQSSQGG